MTKGVYSEFEIRAMGIKIGDTEECTTASCVGSCEETMTARVIEKKCRGIVAKTIVKGDGTGELKISMHVPYEIYKKAYGMELDSLIDGVYAYGENSTHPTLSIVQDVYDEDDVNKVKAYPNCIIKEGVTNKTENGATEVAELELTISVMPDDYGNGVYEALVDDLTDTDKETWMSSFTPDLVQASTTA